MISDVIHLCTLNPQVVVLVAKLLQSEFQNPSTYVMNVLHV